ncbi:MAG: hypothetical protein JO081_18200 [Alphaproteobacteria bacterium]|nr:hypothetical protein [Alphaproteobacteria bacterium]
MLKREVAEIAQTGPALSLLNQMLGAGRLAPTSQRAGSHINTKGQFAPGVRLLANLLDLTQTPDLAKFQATRWVEPQGK